LQSGFISSFEQYQHVCVILTGVAAATATTTTSQQLWKVGNCSFCCRSLHFGMYFDYVISYYNMYFYYDMIVENVMESFIRYNCLRNKQ
jgi:hypothetical protein